ncbi:MAG: ATP-binding protein [Chryseolinea sp.]
MASHITHETAAPEFFSGGGEMGKLIRSKDWSKTPLGSPESWPQSLRTTVSLCIASNFPISIAWGPHRVQIYNDGYWPVTGDKHPASMGQDFKECWFSAWPVIGQAFEEASLGQTRFLENQRIFIDRYGYLEETFFTFSFSPILDETGGVGGLFHPVIELTQQTIAERRLNVLRVVADNTVNPRTLEEASSLMLGCLRDFELDLPFVLLYAIAADGKEASLQGNVGVEKDSLLANSKIDLGDQSLKSWPFTEAIQNGKAVKVEGLTKIFGAFNCGPYAEAPEQALVFPVSHNGTDRKNYVLIAGVSSRRNLDEKYMLFYELLSASVTNALTKARAYDEERRKAEALAEIDKAKTVFFSNISHEFRTPLTLMLGSLEGLLNRGDDVVRASEKEAIETSHRNAVRLLRLVNNLLDFSRIEAGRVQAHYQLTDLPKYTTELASNFRSIVENAGLIFQVKTDTITDPVYIDTEMWEKIVLNLLSNAFKYTLKGSIALSLAAENDHVLLKIEDTGVGIPENELPKMFQRFHRVQNVVARTYEGTGIGLSLVSELVKLHGGEITVLSKEAKGSVFTVSIPTGKSHLPIEQVFDIPIEFTNSFSDAFIDEATTLLDQSILIANATESLNGNADAITVLVVDDNADMRAYIKNLLKRQYHVVTANNGMDALQQIKEHSPRLILCDIMMPVMDGIQLLKAVKENIQTCNIPVILLSARAGEESKIEGYEIGADDYLVKPFSAKELLARVSSNIKTAAIRSTAEKHLYNLLMQTPVAIAIYRGPDFVVELVNDRMVEFYGRPREEMINRPIFEVFPEMAAHGLEGLHRKVYESGERVIANEQKHEYYKKGELYNGYFNTVFEPLRDLDDNVIGLIVTGHEVTEEVTARKKIEESEARFRTMADASPVLIWTIEANGKSSYYNKTFRDFIGVSEDQDISDWKKIVHPEDLQSTFNTINTAIAERRAYSLECRLLRADGHWRWVLAQGNPRTGANNDFFGFVGSSVDITERKYAEEKIRASEQRFQNLIYSSPSAIGILMGPGLVVTTANDPIIAIWGKGQEIMGKSYFEALPELAEQGYREVFNEVYTKGKAAHFVETPVRILQDGEMTLKYYDFVLYPQRNVAGEVEGIGIIASEVTSQAENNNKIKESESRFRSLADQSPMIVYLVEADAAATMSYFNKCWLDYTGQTFDDAIGRAWNGIVHPDDLQGVLDTYVPAFLARKPYTLPAVRLRRHDGEYRWHLFKGNPRYLQGGEFIGYVGVGFDVHDQKITEETLEALVNERTRKLQRSNEDLQQFAHVASHDLKEPVRKIRTFGNRITQEFGRDLPAKAKTYLDKMQSAADRMYAMIDGVLMYSSLDATDQKTETIDLNEVFSQIESDLEVMITLKVATIQFNRLTTVEGSPILIYQLFYNLIYNSLKFSKADTPPLIEITSERKEEFVRVFVKDNGIGFTQNEGEKIFKTFSRLHPKDQYEGTGLGLALCKKIVERHGGTISATSVENEGSVFEAIFPFKSSGNQI